MSRTDLRDTTPRSYSSPGTGRVPKLLMYARRWTVILLILYLAVLAMLAALQRKLIYHPRTDGDFSISAHPELSQLYPDSATLRITTEDNLTVGGWHMKHPNQATLPASERQLLIMFHGNAGDRSWRISWYQIFQKLGVDVLAIDYRGYGDSEGSPSEAGLKLDARATWDFAIKELGYSHHRTTILGVSLGGAVAVSLAHHTTTNGTPPAALAIMASFSSMTDVAAFHYWWLPVRWILVDQYRSADDIRSVTCPILHIHGDLDTVVPIEFGRRLFQAAPETSGNGIEKRWITLKRIGHNQLAESSANTILPALRQLLGEIAEKSENGVQQ